MSGADRIDGCMACALPVTIYEGNVAEGDGCLRLIAVACRDCRLSSERPRHYQRELLAPERVAMRSGPLGHNDVRAGSAARPPSGSRSGGRTAPVCRRRDTRAAAIPASLRVAVTRTG
jgi:hypothetical protein